MLILILVVKEVGRWKILDAEFKIAVIGDCWGVHGEMSTKRKM
jgi:hypothetical protein